MGKEKIRELRLKAGFSQEKLAHRIGITRQTINLIEAGKYNPSLKICKGIARELDATLDDLFDDYWN